MPQNLDKLMYTILAVQLALEAVEYCMRECDERQLTSDLVSFLTSRLRDLDPEVCDTLRSISQNGP